MRSRASVVNARLPRRAALTAVADPVHRGVLTADSAQVPPKRPEQLTSLEQDLTRDGAAQRVRHQPDRHVGYDISAGEVAPYPSCCPTAASTGTTLLSGRQKAADVQNHLLLNNQP